jgi:hypothetical protein
MAIAFVGIDLAKSVFAVNGVNPAGKPELVRPSVPRAKLHKMTTTSAGRRRLIICFWMDRLRPPRLLEHGAREHLIGQTDDPAWRSSVRRGGRPGSFRR